MVNGVHHVYHITVSISVLNITKIMILIPGHGQQDHEDPDGQRRRLDDPQHRQQGERIPLLRAERERCGEDHFLHFILLIFNFPSDQPMLLGKYSGSILFPVD